MLLFAHIPKTAGTSFRIALEEYYGEETVLKDYGFEVHATSGEIQNMYDEGFNNVATCLNEKQSGILISHFHDTAIGLAGYKKLIPEAGLATIFRDPLSRSLSEYYHFRDKLDYKGSLLDFWDIPHFQNRQVISLGHVPLDSFDFIGLTEKYSETLDLFNEIYGTSLDEKHVNTRSSRSSPSEKLAANDIKYFCERNIEEITLYNHAVISFYRLIREHIPINAFKRYASSFRVTDDSIVQGWAIDYESLHPVRLKIETSDKSLSCIAGIFRKDLLDSRYHISGYCGFQISVEFLRHRLGNRELTISFYEGPIIGKVRL